MVRSMIMNGKEADFDGVRISDLEKVLRRQNGRLSVISVLRVFGARFRKSARLLPEGWIDYAVRTLHRLTAHQSDELHYIGGSDSLPPPLSTEQEQKMLEAFMAGSDEARTVLIEHNLRLVVYISKKFENSGVNLEDLISIGTIGLIKAVNTFKMDKNIKLATYASRCIENEILMYLRRANRIKGEVSLDEPLNVDWDGNELLLSDVLGTEQDVIHTHLEEEVNKNLLNYAMSTLSGREKQLMEMRYGLISGREMTQKEVADELGISQSYISRLEKKIIHRLRREIKKLG